MSLGSLMDSSLPSSSLSNNYNSNLGYYVRMCMTSGRVPCYSDAHALFCCCKTCIYRILSQACPRDTTWHSCWRSWSHFSGTRCVRGEGGRSQSLCTRKHIPQTYFTRMFMHKQSRKCVHVDIHTCTYIHTYK